MVIELKRTEHGGHMELQAIRYAAMISTLTFDKLVTIYERYLNDNGIEQDATESLLEFLDWNEPDEEQFGQEVKTVLASAEFSKELTTSVMWLNDFGWISGVFACTPIRVMGRSSSTCTSSSQSRKLPITRSVFARKNKGSVRPETAARISPNMTSISPDSISRPKVNAG